MSFEDGPYVQAACICNLVLQDQTNTFSLIRLVDRLTHHQSGPNPPAEMPPVIYEGTLVLMLKPGEARGRYNLRIVPQLPSKELGDPLIATTINFEGEARGQNLTLNIRYVFTLEGVYWFKVYLDEEIITAIPFRVIYSHSTTGPVQ